MVKRPAGGFSLLEILFSMVLFLVVVAAFAMVFPSGYHLNLKAYRENQGVELANAILQEIISKPIEVEASDKSTGDSLQNLGGFGTANGSEWTGECPRNGGLPQCGCTNSGKWTPQALCTFYANNPDVASEYQYSLPPAGSAQTGIQVGFLVDPSPGMVSDNGLATVTVNLQWMESGSGQPRIITLTTFATYDRD